MRKIEIPQYILDEHLIYCSNNPLEKLREAIKNHRGPAKNFLEYLYDNFKTIIVGTPEKLSEINEYIRQNFENELESLRVSKKLREPKIDSSQKKGDVLEEIFNYGNFIKCKERAYRFAAAIGVNACVYCNRQFTNTDFQIGIRPSFDHFYSQKLYPYLALSLYNLVPCCTLCNSALKGTEEFSLETHLNPYCDSFDDCMRFSLDYRKNDEECLIDFLLSGKMDKKTIFITLKKRMLNNNTAKIALAEKNAKIFKLEEIYQHHIDYVEELVQNAVFYNDSRISELKTVFGDILPEKDIYRMILHNYADKKDINKRILSKLARDIALELGILPDSYKDSSCV